MYIASIIGAAHITSGITNGLLPSRHLLSNMKATNEIIITVPMINSLVNVSLLQSLHLPV